MRATFKTIGFVVLTTVFYSLWVCARICLAAFPNQKNRCRNWVFRNWARGMCALLGLRIDVNGSPPAQPFLMVSNHLSYVDVIVLAALVDGVFIAKSEVADWPILGRVVNGIGTIFINRQNARDLTRVSALIQSAIQRGQGVFLFPEGTSTRGAEVLPFKPGLLEAAAQTEMPVHYASLSYRTLPNEQPAELSVCWWGEMSFLPHLWALFQLSRIHCEITFGAEPIIEKNRKVLAERLHAAVQENFEPSRGPITVNEGMQKVWQKVWKKSCQWER